MTELKKEVEKSTIEVGNHIIKIIVMGIYEMKSRHLIETYSECIEKDFYILMPRYMNSFFLAAIKDKHRTSMIDDKLSFQGIEILAGYETNKIVFYHKDWCKIGIDPVVLHVEKPKSK
jgi:hypothetical protein